MELSTARAAFVPLPFQPEMVPSSVSKIKRLGPVVPPELTGNPVVPFATVPVGAEMPATPFGAGILTISVWIFPCASYSVDRPLLLSAIQKVLPGKNDMPQGLIRLGSVTFARPGVSETKFVWV